MAEQAKTKKAEVVELNWQEEYKKLYAAYQKLAVKHANVLAAIKGVITVAEDSIK